MTFLLPHEWKQKVVHERGKSGSAQPYVQPYRVTTCTGCGLTGTYDDMTLVDLGDTDDIYLCPLCTAQPIATSIHSTLGEGHRRELQDRLYRGVRV